MSGHDRMKAHRIVQTCLDIAGAVRCCTVEIRNLNADRFCAALEIRAYRCSKDTELILVSRLYADDRADTENIRAQIQCRTGSVRRNPRFVGLDNLKNSLYESVLRERRNLEPLCGVVQSLGVQIRPECNCAAVLCRISLQSFEYGLRILKHTCVLAHGNHAVV